MARDSQRSAVYKWEHDVEAVFNLEDKLTLDECVELVHKVWNDYRPGDQPPKVKDGRGTRRAFANRWEVNLPRWARRSVVVLHEVCHAIRITDPWHGPEFARLYLEILNHYLKVPKGKAKSMGVHQKPRRVRFAPAGACCQRVNREWRKWKREWEEANAAVEVARRKLVELNRREPKR